MGHRNPPGDEIRQSASPPWPAHNACVADRIKLGHLPSTSGASVFFGISANDRCDGHGALPPAEGDAVLLARSGEACALLPPAAALGGRVVLVSPPARDANAAESRGNTPSCSRLRCV